MKLRNGLIGLLAAFCFTAASAEDLVADNEWITPNKGCVTASTSNGNIVVENNCPMTVRAEGCFVQPPVDVNNAADIGKLPVATLYRLAVFAYCKDRQTQSFGFGGRPTLAAGERRVLKFDEKLQRYLEIVSCPERATVKMVSTSTVDALCYDYSVRLKLESQRKPIADSLRQPKRSRLDAMLDEESGSSRLDQMLDEGDGGGKLDRLMQAEEQEEKERQRAAEAARRILAQQAATAAEARRREAAEARRREEAEERRRQREEERAEREEADERRAESDRQTNALANMAAGMVAQRYGNSGQVNRNAGLTAQVIGGGGRSGSSSSSSSGGGNGGSNCAQEDAQYGAELNGIVSSNQNSICNLARASARTQRNWVPRFQRCDSTGYRVSELNKQIASNDSMAREVCDDRPKGAQTTYPSNRTRPSQTYIPTTDQGNGSAPVGSGAR